MKRITTQFGFFLLLVVSEVTNSAEIPKAPVPKSPFIPVVYRYADTMLKNGRDKTGLFWSAMDRNTLAPLTNRPAAPEGVRLNDRIGTNGALLIGSNPYHDENLLRLLSMLSDLSAKPHYRAAADAELRWFAANAGSMGPEQFRPWMLWDRCFEIEPEASKRALTRLSEQKIATGTWELQRTAGFSIRALAVAYAFTKDERFTRAITAWLEQQERNALPDFTPSLAIDCEGAAHHLPQPLASRLRLLAARKDEIFCSVSHDIKKNGGFVTDILERRDRPVPRYTSMWKATRETQTTAQVGMMCVSRYDNTGKTPYRDLVIAAADNYLEVLPGDSEDVWPVTFGHAISLELAAWRHSADWKYMERARKLGEIAVEEFWGTNALPKASYKTDHYETITGADTLALALVELHLNILHITAVRCPPNTIDR